MLLDPVQGLKQLLYLFHKADLGLQGVVDVDDFIAPGGVVKPVSFVDELGTGHKSAAVHLENDRELLLHGAFGRIEIAEVIFIAVVHVVQIIDFLTTVICTKKLLTFFRVCDLFMPHKLNKPIIFHIFSPCLVCFPFTITCVFSIMQT